MVCNKLMDTFKTHVNAVGLGTLAKRLGVSAQRLSNWLDRGVPLDFCPVIEQATSGAVMRWDLRPDDWHRIWPELRRRKDAPAIAAKAAA